VNNNNKFKKLYLYTQSNSDYFYSFFLVITTHLSWNAPIHCQKHFSCCTLHGPYL